MEEETVKLEEVKTERDERTEREEEGHWNKAPTGGIPRVRRINSLPMIHAPGYESSAPSTCIGKQTRQTLGRMCKRCTNTQVGQYSPPLTRDKKPPFDRASPSTNIGEHSGEYPAVTLAGRGRRIFGVGPNNASVTAALILRPVKQLLKPQDRFNASVFRYLPTPVSGMIHLNTEKIRFLRDVYFWNPIFGKFRGLPNSLTLKTVQNNFRLLVNELRLFLNIFIIERCADFNIPDR
ncbi:unnamed protein product, partial [Nesidiocoris tenuis]